MKLLHLCPTMPSKSLIKSPSPNPNPNPKSNSNPNPNPKFNTNSHPICKHTQSATLDLLILILVLFSSTFLIISYLSYLFNSFSLLLSPHPFSSFSLAFLLLFLLTFLLFLDRSLCSRSRKCHRPCCKGLKKALEFDLQIQTEDTLRSGSSSVKDIDRLPWKGGTETNPDYECLRAELRKMAPPNGRAVLLFRARCGCPVAKLLGWAPKKARRHKKALAAVAVNGKDRR